MKEGDQVPHTHNNFAPASINAILDSCSKAKLVGLFWIGFNHCSTNIIETMAMILCKKQAIAELFWSTNFPPSFLFLFSPPNTAKETTRKKCHHDVVEVDAANIK
eukprot:scaffold4397_cov165-Skeletonema_dohrnii-CCMP3373.AAC.1